MNRPLWIWYYGAVLFLGVLIFSYLKINLDTYKEYQLVPVPRVHHAPPILGHERQEPLNWNYSQEKKVYLVTWNGQSRELTLYKNNEYFYRDNLGNYSNGYWTRNSKNNRTFLSLNSYSFDEKKYVFTNLLENRNWNDLHTEIQFQDKVFILTYEHKLKEMEDGAQYYEEIYYTNNISILLS